MRRRAILRAAHEAARSLGEPLSSLRGWTLAEALRAADQPGVVIGWGCWSDDELASVI